MCVDGAGPEFLAHHWPHAALDFSTCPKYGPPGWELSKMQTYLVPARTRTCAINVRPEWNCSLPSISYCWRSFSSSISHFLSLLSSVTLLAWSLDTSPWMPAAACIQSLCVRAQSLWSSHFFATSWTVAHQVPLSTGFFRQDWSGLPFPSPGDLPDRGIKLGSPALQADSLPSEPLGKPCCTVLLYFSRYSTIRLKMSIFVFYVLFVWKYYEPLTVKYYVVSCASWVPRLTLLDLQTNWTWEYALGTELIRSRGPTVSSSNNANEVTQVVRWVISGIIPQGTYLRVPENLKSEK